MGERRQTMRKVVAVLMVLVLALVLVPAGVVAHTEEDPLVVDLLAGQTEDIGDVKVWNDVDTLYVQFVYEGPDCGFLEVHLQVDEGWFAEDILTKKGNPIPGKFEKSYSDGCFAEKTFTYDLSDEGFACNDDLVIAAHAALGREECITIVSGDGQTSVTQRRPGNGTVFTPMNAPAALAWEPGPNYPNDDADDSSWEAWSLWDQRLSVNLVPTGADWIWESYRVQDPTYGTVLTFQRTFDIGYPTSAGNLLIACDNGYEVFLNGTSLGSDNVYGDWKPSNLKQAYVDVSGWNAVGSYPMFDHLLEGTNTLTIDAANEYFNTDDSGNPAPGTQSSNPGACIFALEEDICYLESGETAWGCLEGENCYDFPGKNWATYFNYTVQCPPVCPGITDSSKITVLPEPLGDVRQAQTTSETPQIFAEYAGTDHGGFTLDINASNETNATGTPNGYAVDAELPVCSYYVHFDDGDYDEIDIVKGFVTFEAPVMGLIVAGTINTSDIFYKQGINTMCDVDPKLGNDATTTYPETDCGINGDARGLEIFNVDPTLPRNQNQDPVKIDGHTLYFDLLIANKHDSFRIILPASP
jgi:hypothetical protein